MKYIIDFAKSFDRAQKFNASKKAPADIQRTMESMGAKCEYIVLPDSKSRPAIWYAKLRSLLRLFCIFKSGDELFFQGYGYERAAAMLVKCRGGMLTNHAIPHSSGDQRRAMLRWGTT